MITATIENSNSIIYEEFDYDKKIEYFDMKQKKFIPNIDTFYYTIKFKKTEFSLRETKNLNTIKFRNYFNNIIKRIQPGFNPLLDLPNVPGYLYFSGMKFVNYDISLKRDDYYDIFFASFTPNELTSECVVQIRSFALWQFGVDKCLDMSLKDIRHILDNFDIKIDEVKENRIDLCWHTNYFVNPQKFFVPDKIAKMRVSKLKDCIMHLSFKGRNDFEPDYIAFGQRNKCYLRMYFKSKEVCDKGYKAFFIKLWYLNNMINKYDFEVFNKCFIKHDYNYINKARLEFYIEHGDNPDYIKICKDYLEFNSGKKYDDIKNLADRLTPPVTIIYNIEYQVMRRMTKSFELLPDPTHYYKAPDYPVRQFIYNLPLIADYLTRVVFRLVKESGDENKSRRPLIPFWELLRATDITKITYKSADGELLRVYNHKMDKEVLKNRIISGITSLSIYNNGINENDLVEDFADVLNLLNDNDIENAQKKKIDRQQRLTDNQLRQIDDMDFEYSNKYNLIDLATGELLNRRN